MSLKEGRVINIEDIRDFDAMLKRRIARYREKLRDWLSPHRATLKESRVYKVLIPMTGVYSVGWQCLPAVSWEYVELVTDDGMIATGEWPVNLGEDTRNCLEQLKTEPDRNLLDLDL